VGGHFDKREEDLGTILPVKIPRVVPFLLIVFSIATTTLLIPIEFVQVRPIIMTRTELVRATISSTKTQTITGITYLTTTERGLLYGGPTQIVAVTVTMTATTTVVVVLSKTETYTTSGTTTETTTGPRFPDPTGVIDFLAKITSFVSGTLGIVSFILRRRTQGIVSK